MNTKEKYLEHYGNKKVPSLLLQLLDREDWIGESSFSDGLSLTDEVEDFDDWIENWFKDSKSLDTAKLVEFMGSHLYFLGRADATGGMYTFFLTDPADDLTSAPIVFFGSEGETNFAASSFDEFLRLVELNAEPRGDDFERENYLLFFQEDDEEYMPDTDIENFKLWLREKGIPPTDSFEQVEDICVNAQNKYFDTLEDFFVKAGLTN